MHKCPALSLQICLGVQEDSSRPGRPGSERQVLPAQSIDWRLPCMLAAATGPKGSFPFVPLCSELCQDGA